MKTLAITLAESEGLTAYALSAENLEQVAGGAYGGASDIVEAITKGLVEVVKMLLGELTFDDLIEFEEWYLPREKIIDALLVGHVRVDYYRVYMAMSKGNREEIRENVFWQIHIDDPDPEKWF